MTTIRNPELSAEINALFEIVDGRYAVEVLGGGEYPTALSYFGHYEAIEADPEIIKARIKHLDENYPVLRADFASKCKKADDLAAETGCDVSYSEHGGFKVHFGATVRTGVLPDSTSVLAAQASMEASVWNKPSPVAEKL